MEKNREFDICNIDVHRASPAKHLGSIKQEEVLNFTPSNMFNETNTIEPKEKNNPKPFKGTTREKINENDKQLKKIS